MESFYRRAKRPATSRKSGEGAAMSLSYIVTAGTTRCGPSHPGFICYITKSITSVEDRLCANVKGKILMTDRLRLDIVRSRDLIDRGLKNHPEFRGFVGGIAERLDTNIAHYYDDSPEQWDRDEVAFRERVLANLKERELALALKLAAKLGRRCGR
jgi:hypothetical protein